MNYVDVIFTGVRLDGSITFIIESILIENKEMFRIGFGRLNNLGINYELRKQERRVITWRHDCAKLALSLKGWHDISNYILKNTLVHFFFMNVVVYTYRKLLI